MEAYFTKINGILIPSFDEDKEKIKKLKNGTPVKIKYSIPRNYEFHKKYFALLHLAFENQEIINNFDDFREEIIKFAGFYKKTVTLRGDVLYKAKSISFANMDDSEFNNLYFKSIDVIIKFILKGNTKEEIEEEVELMTKIVDFV